MSMSGLAFRYIPREEPSSGPSELHIFLAGNAYVYKVPFKTICDQEAEQVPSSFLTMRRCGVQFGELTQSQIAQLEYFIQNYAMGQV
jgi:hypothetical protein